MIKMRKTTHLIIEKWSFSVPSVVLFIADLVTFIHIQARVGVFYNP